MEDIIKYKNELIAGVIALVFLFIIKGSFSGYSSQMGVIDQSSQQIQQRGVLLARWNKMDKDYAKLENEVFFDSPFAFKRLIEEIARENDVSIEELKPSSVEKNGFTQAQVNLGVKAGYKDFLSFVAGLEDKNIEVKKILISNSFEKDKKVVVVLKGFVANN